MVSIKLIPKASWPLVAGAFVATLFSNAGAWLLTNDDFLGLAVDQTKLTQKGCVGEVHPPIVAKRADAGAAGTAALAEWRATTLARQKMACRDASRAFL